jgi:hypothetical protein
MGPSLWPKKRPPLALLSFQNLKHGFHPKNKDIFLYEEINDTTLGFSSLGFQFVKFYFSQTKPKMLAPK